MKIIRFTTEDVLELKKTHPCGSREFSVLRIGSEVRIRCKGCGRESGYVRRGKAVELIRSGRGSRLRCRACGGNNFELYIKE